MDINKTVTTVGELIEVLKEVSPDTPLTISASAYTDADHYNWVQIRQNRWKSQDGIALDIDTFQYGYDKKSKEVIRISNSTSTDMEFTD